MYDDNLRNRLISLAAEQIATGGVDSLSLRNLATAADTSTNAVYTLFGGRDQLVDEVVAATADSFLREQLAVRTTEDPRADLIALGHAYRSWALAHPAMYAVMFNGRLRLPSMADEDADADEDAQETINPLLDLSGRAQSAAGSAARPLSVEDLALSIMAVVHGTVSLELGPLADMPAGWHDANYDRQLHMLVDHWLGPAGTGSA